jgi:P-type Mg2+ transporter
MRLIRDFMLYVGPVSSLFDFLTFYVLLRVLHATETLVLFVIRTMGHPLTSRPSRALAISTVAIVGIGLALPATRVGPLLGFTVPPPTYFLFLAAATVTYLALVEVVKRVVVRRLGIRTSRDVIPM